MDTCSPPSSANWPGRWWWRLHGSWRGSGSTNFTELDARLRQVPRVADAAMTKSSPRRSWWRRSNSKAISIEISDFVQLLRRRIPRTPLGQTLRAPLERLLTEGDRALRARRLCYLYAS